MMLSNLGRREETAATVREALQVYRRLAEAYPNARLQRAWQAALVHQAAVDRVRRDGGILRACDVLVVVEIVASGSHRTDHVIKRGEYADAGIPHYWIVVLHGVRRVEQRHVEPIGGFSAPEQVPSGVSRG